MELGDIEDVSENPVASRLAVVILATVAVAVAVFVIPLALGSFVEALLEIATHG